jgi:hypothetical protein
LSGTALAAPPLTTGVRLCYESQPIRD